MHVFQFETKQGEDICVALQTHINKKHIQRLSKALEESQKTARKLSEELQEKQKKESSMQEELETLKDMLRSERKSLEELSSKYNEIRSLCEEKESNFQAVLIEKQNMEARLLQLSKGELENNNSIKELVEATASYNQVLQKFQDKSLLRTRNSENKWLNEMEERISWIGKEKDDEIRLLEKDMEQERKMTKSRISQLEKKVEELTQKQAIKDNEISNLHINLQEFGSFKRNGG